LKSFYNNLNYYYFIINFHNNLILITIIEFFRVNILKIIIQKEPDLEKEDSVLELEIGTNYSEDNAHEVEKEDDNLAAIVVDSVESDKNVEGLYLEKERQKKMKRNRGMKRPIANGL